MRHLFIFCLTIAVLFSCAKDKASQKEIDEKIKDTIVAPTKVDTESLDAVVDDEEIETSIIFTVQIAALHNPNNNHKDFRNADVYKEGNFTKYRIGHFQTYKEAKLYKEKVLKTYPGAFVQALENDKPIHISKALQ
jgi:hypothetical protein